MVSLSYSYVRNNTPLKHYSGRLLLASLLLTLSSGNYAFDNQAFGQVSLHASVYVDLCRIQETTHSILAKLDCILIELMHMCTDSSDDTFLETIWRAQRKWQKCSTCRFSVLFERFPFHSAILW